VRPTRSWPVQLVGIQLFDVTNPKRNAALRHGSSHPRTDAVGRCVDACIGSIEPDAGSERRVSGAQRE
jgi:hypothetical protein